MVVSVLLKALHHVTTEEQEGTVLLDIFFFCEDEDLFISPFPHTDGKGLNWTMTYVFITRERKFWKIQMYIVPNFHQ